MKHCMITFIILIMFSNKFRVQALNFEEFLFNAQDSNNTPDPDDVIIQMKKFFDEYAAKLKNSIKSVDKILIPNDSGNNTYANTNTEAFIPIYVPNFDMDNLKRLSQNFIDENNQIREKDLRNAREDKQMTEEENIDLVTKKKFLISRTNIARSENNKIIRDKNEKTNTKNSIESMIENSKIQAEKLVGDNLGKIKNLKKNMILYEKNINHLPLDESLFEQEMNIPNLIEKLHSDIFKSEFERSFFSLEKSSLKDMIRKLSEINHVFQKRLGDMRMKNKKLIASVRNKTENLDHIKKEIANKFAMYSNMNRTIAKLEKIKMEYTKALSNIEENLNMMKSKKKIILNSIEEKKKLRMIKKTTIGPVLNKIEKDLEKFNVGKIGVNKQRKEISEINSRMKNILVKENMIFKKNKIKI